MGRRVVDTVGGGTALLDSTPPSPPRPGAQPTLPLPPYCIAYPNVKAHDTPSPRLRSAQGIMQKDFYITPWSAQQPLPLSPTPFSPRRPTTPSTPPPFSHLLRSPPSPLPPLPIFCAAQHALPRGRVRRRLIPLAKRRAPALPPGLVRRVRPRGGNARGAGGKPMLYIRLQGSFAAV